MRSADCNTNTHKQTTIPPWDFPNFLPSSLGSLRGSTAHCIMVCHQEINQMLRWWHHLFVGEGQGGNGGNRGKAGRWERQRERRPEAGKITTETGCIQKPRISKFNPLSLLCAFKLTASSLNNQILAVCTYWLFAFRTQLLSLDELFN